MLKKRERSRTYQIVGVWEYFKKLVLEYFKKLVWEYFKKLVLEYFKKWVFGIFPILGFGIFQKVGFGIFKKRFFFAVFGIFKVDSTFLHSIFEKTVFNACL